MIVGDPEVIHMSEKSPTERRSRKFARIALVKSALRQLDA